VSQYQKGKTNLDFTEARDSEWQWHQLGHMQVCTSLQTDSHSSTPPLSFFTGRMPFLLPNQQHQSTEGTAPFHIQPNYNKIDAAKNIYFLFYTYYILAAIQPLAVSTDATCLIGFIFGSYSAPH